MNRALLMTLAGAGALLSFVLVAHAADTSFVPLAPIPGLTEGVTPTEGSVAGFLNNLYIFLIGAAVVLAVIMIIWGGVEYAISEAIPAKGDGKKKIQQALFGLLLVLAPVLVFTIINPKILNLDVNFPALRTEWGDFGGAVTGAHSNDACPTLVDRLAGTCVSSNWMACRDSNDCSSVIKSCPTGILNFDYKRICVKSDETTYAPGTSGAPTDSCNSGDAAACLSLHH